MSKTALFLSSTTLAMLRGEKAKHSTRLLSGLVSMALLVFGLVVLLPDCASACTCAFPPGSQQERTERALAESTAVFAGEVVDKKIVRTAYGAGFLRDVDKVSFRVFEVWKGQKRETLEVMTESYGPACGYSFKEGQEYLVYAYGKKEPFETNACTENRLLSKAGANLRVLGAGQRLGAESLPDTSGEVAGHGVLGLAGLATTTAAFLLLRRLLKSG